MSGLGSKAKGSKPGYTNPAFRMMGIPALRLPSRNWMIFWSVVTASVSGIAYDKYKQKQIRSHYKAAVKPLSSGSLDVNRKPRKITVFIAPPPGDYLDTSLKVWKRYVKPILYYAGLDYEVIEEEKQGFIRTEVANRIRELRRQLRQAQSQNSSQEKEELTAVQGGDDEFNAELAKQFKSDFDYRDVMGIFYNAQKPTVVYEDALNPDPSFAGGVICLGRGAYKEYITGLHEGLLGPLDPPEASTDLPENEKAEQDKISSERDGQTANAETNDELNGEQESGSGKSEETEEDKKTGSNNALKPFISPDEYSDVEFPVELSAAHNDPYIRDPATQVPFLFHQAVLMIPVPNLIGFLNIPERIYRFYQKRYYAQAVSSAVADMVNQKDIRPFEHPQDLALGEEEEDDWPKSWIREGEKRKSEWTRELKDDPRVIEYIRVYNKPKSDSQSD
ncbi:hypothetical protein HG536_0F02110 [Torulaspora globosa]|uniref:Mitochondrial import inner membrane translocase subunit TIM54 n=1 Tax=Torulaspora globosa TaxID=48254 RepID=A0A7G3ZK50_9SACH|nr:uncharacterized protein HG536_0F02110 [Torulaspora globosa]QLL33886.1 hypothetical protein HG536_0F02110 [Torulaspora globosa]